MQDVECKMEDQTVAQLHCVHRFIRSFGHLSAQAEQICRNTQMMRWKGDEARSSEKQEKRESRVLAVDGLLSLGDMLHLGCVGVAMLRLRYICIVFLGTTRLCIVLGLLGYIYIIIYI